MPSRIEDYAIIGDCETVALVARDGSIDWLCFPRFDSEACFAALLGRPEHGRWQIAPAGEVRAVRRRYRRRPSPSPDVEQAIRETDEWWREWSGRCTYQGPWREAVLRSLITLKALTYAPTGGVLAAGTTSLPEQLGGVRNWDYRYCWLRDACFTLRALFALGYYREAEAFLQWMLHATRLTCPELQVVYDVFGEANLPELELPHLHGYAG